MGEAKRRKAEIEKLKAANPAFLNGLDAAERAVVDAALKLHHQLMEIRNFTGGCYYMAFFLHRYLLEKKGITTALRIGYVNDGASPVMISHGWIEHHGRIADISLTKTEFPEAQLQGALLVLGHVWKKGVASYTYHLERGAAGNIANQRILNSTDSVVRHTAERKEDEHQLMLDTAVSLELIRAYFDKAPRELGYEAVIRLIEA